ncbi:hypothetical protein M2169_005876 [Streptomyces sp. MJP52]|nr:hypothetical protein [Streptomyces sp. MJP52]
MSSEQSAGAWNEGQDLGGGRGPPGTPGCDHNEEVGAAVGGAHQGRDGLQVDGEHVGRHHDQRDQLGVSRDAQVEGRLEVHGHAPVVEPGRMIISMVTVVQSRLKRPVSMASRCGATVGWRRRGGACRLVQGAVLSGQDQQEQQTGGRRGQQDRGEQPGVAEDTEAAGRGEAEEGNRDADARVDAADAVQRPQGGGGVTVAGGAEGAA